MGLLVSSTLLCGRLTKPLLMSADPCRKEATAVTLCIMASGSSMRWLCALPILLLLAATAIEAASAAGECRTG
jgi:hypothetical protein